MTRCKDILFGAVVFSSLLPLHASASGLGLGVSYLYPAGRLGKNLGGAAQAEVSLTAPALPRTELGARVGYANLRGTENRHLRVILSTLEAAARVRVMELTEASSMVMETGLGMIGICRTLNSGREGTILGGEGVVSFGLGVDVPFGSQIVELNVVYRAILDPVRRGDLFSVGGSVILGSLP